MITKIDTEINMAQLAEICAENVGSETLLI
jgi:hypothetical protein